jgi:hypothetical protein
VHMNSLPGEAEAGERLKQTALRDFSPIPEDETERGGRSYDDPAPALDHLRATLTAHHTDRVSGSTHAPGSSPLTSADRHPHSDCARYADPTYNDALRPPPPTPNPTASSRPSWPAAPNALSCRWSSW